MQDGSDQADQVAETTPVQFIDDSKVEDIFDLQPKISLNRTQVEKIDVEIDLTNKNKKEETKAPLPPQSVTNNGKVKTFRKIIKVRKVRKQIHGDAEEDNNKPPQLIRFSQSKDNLNSSILSLNFDTQSQGKVDYSKIRQIASTQSHHRRKKSIIKELQARQSQDKLVFNDFAGTEKTM